MISSDASAPCSEGLSLDLILASTSPRRAELLTAAGQIFRVIDPGVEESDGAHFTPRELTLLNARRKSHAVAAFCPTSTVLGADTIVAIDNEILGKPLDLEDAARMLSKLSGRTHDVVTSIWLVRLHPFYVASLTEISHVTFRALSSSDIQDYLGKINPLDKAGAYAAQEYRESIIQKIEGSLNNVIGLPVESLAPLIEEFR